MPATADSAVVGLFGAGTIGASPELSACCAALHEEQELAALMMWCQLPANAPAAGRKMQLQRNAAALKVSLPAACN